MTEYGDPNGPEADFLREISPVHRAETITAPLPVMHGRNDPRVPVGESMQIAEAVDKSDPPTCSDAAFRSRRQESNP